MNLLFFVNLLSFSYISHLTAQEIPAGKLAPAIFGGQDANPNQWPWHVAINAYGGFTCSGALFNERWVVTAGHCLYNQLNRPIRSSEIAVRFGIHYLSTNPEGNTFNITDYVIHPDFQYVLNSQGKILLLNDIALVQLAQPIKINSNSQLRLPTTKERLPDGASVLITGWGYTYKAIFPQITKYNINTVGIITTATYITVQPDGLQQLYTTLASQQDCQDFTTEQPDVICVGNANGTGPCQGDSGGPLVARNGNKKKWTLYGVLSKGPDQCAGLPGISGIYTEIAAFVPWIHNITNSRRS